MELKIPSITEKLYAFSPSHEIGMKTGLIGHLRADFGGTGKNFHSSWFDFREDLKTKAFKEELDKVINFFRNGKRKEDSFLKGESEMSDFFFAYPEARTSDTDAIVRVNTEEYTYMMRLSPIHGVYNLYCYCYIKEWFDNHLKNAEKGIRFVDTDYKTLFTIPDHGKIEITYPDGEKVVSTCRFIDQFHFEIGVNDDIYHILEFAQRMAACKATYKAV